MSDFFNFSANLGFGYKIVAITSLLLMGMSSVAVYSNIQANVKAEEIAKRRRTKVNGRREYDHLLAEEMVL